MSKLFSGIGSKIILPYLLLTLLVAGIGAFIVVNLVTGTLQERFNNQLLDAGRVVAESMVGYEADRLAVLRQVAFTEGVAESLASGDQQGLTEIVPQIIANSPADAVVLLDGNGRERLSWQRFQNTNADANRQPDFAQIPDVQLVLSGFADEFGDKRAFLAETAAGPMLFTVGPVFLDEEQVGAVLIGADARKMAVALTQNAVARVTLYDQNGRVMATTLGDGRENIADLLQEPPAQYATVRQLLQESPERVQVVAENATLKVPLRQLEILNQNYQLAFGDWRLRNTSYGLFSVALPRNFIVNAAATSRDLLNIVFTAATIGVILIGFWVARRIVRPLNRLVDVTTAVTEGDLNQRTGIERKDEIGMLASSFDAMTERLDERTQQLVAQKSELTAILESIADGVIVLDTDDNIVTANPAAQQLLSDLSEGFSKGDLHELINGRSRHHQPLAEDQVRRFEMHGRVLSTSSAPVLLPGGGRLGAVMVLRDITREAEAENLKDNFITGMSHELRTPLTVVKVYSDLLRRSANGQLQEQQYVFLERIIKASSELEEHIQKMINISEIQAGTLNLKRENFSLTELVNAISRHWQPAMAQKGVHFSMEQPAHELTINGDNNRLQWAIDNLIENALNYTPAGNSVRLEVYEQGETVCLDVIDSGIGIASTDQHYIFDRFFRAKNEQNYRERGIGLGLFISKELIALHGGQISVSSKPGAGSTFHCTLPLTTPIAAVVGETD
ncbi:MAG: HAMP domain-containing protein [Chloroflexi bacterium]|nr:HAMP domain-containing protein [Ardenticatenaceae bacterium]NOG34996.1 HAMP domain-containing protein [Chloroflexota bacterium]GIK55231.1 MAG: histidine kinase [Chloroflexota bacterium]